VLSALVLTAGVGSRLDPLTRLVAKPAVPVAGRTLIERVLAWLSRDGVGDVVLNLHYRPDTITGVVGDGAHLGLRVRYSWEQPLLGSAGGPRHALPLLDADTFLIVNGDTLCDVPLAPMLAAHRESGADVTMAVVPNAAPDRYNGVVLDEADRVTGFVPKHAPPAGGLARPDGGRVLRPGTASWHFVGVQIVRAAVFAPLADGTPAETVAGLYREGVASGTLAIRGYRADTPFLDVGTPRDYLDATLRLATGSGAGAIEAGAQVDPAARVVRCVVWAGVRVEAGANLENCIAAGGVRVPAGRPRRGSRRRRGVPALVNCRTCPTRRFPRPSPATSPARASRRSASCRSRATRRTASTFGSCGLTAGRAYSRCTERPSTTGPCPLRAWRNCSPQCPSRCRRCSATPATSACSSSATWVT
jgi:NDP-sugar pyrophosphorylase family protein